MKAIIRALLLFFACTATSFGKDKPNIVLMVMDNLGWGGIGVYGGILRGAETPRLDKLASEGMRFLNFNVETQCTPSRSALMTGRHPIRSGTTKVVWGQLYGMTQWEVTIAELLSEEGYATGMFGKWHLGDTKGRFPTDQGFDEWYGIPNTTDESLYPTGFQFDPEAVEIPHIMQSTKGSDPEKVKVYDREARRRIDAELTERTISFMKRSVAADKPFFAFVPFTQVHLPTVPHPDFDGKTGNGRWADVLAEVDHRAGQILDAIDGLEARDNTIVIWMSENGPAEISPRLPADHIEVDKRTDGFTAKWRKYPPPKQEKLRKQPHYQLQARLPVSVRFRSDEQGRVLKAEPTLPEPVQENEEHKGGGE